MRWALLLVLIALAPNAARSAEPYSFTQDASAQTRAAVAAGKEPDKGYPAIVDIAWSTTSVHPHTTLEAIVTTSTNVNFVGGEYLSWTLRFDQIGPGKFHLKYPIPVLPPFLLGHWTINVVARTSDGVEVRRKSTLSYSYF
jgi:hypothetical protein